MASVERLARDYRERLKSIIGRLIVLTLVLGFLTVLGLLYSYRVSGDRGLLFAAMVIGVWTPLDAAIIYSVVGSSMEARVRLLECAIQAVLARGYRLLGASTSWLRILVSFKSDGKLMLLKVNSHRSLELSIIELLSPAQPLHSTSRGKRRLWSLGTPLKARIGLGTKRGSGCRLLEWSGTGTVLAPAEQGRILYYRRARIEWKMVRCSQYAGDPCRELGEILGRREPPSPHRRRE